jgi:hypothetical protein
LNRRPIAYETQSDREPEPRFSPRIPGKNYHIPAALQARIFAAFLGVFERDFGVLL